MKLEIKNAQQVLECAEEYNVKFIRLQFTDVSGILKNIAITVKDLPRVLQEGMVFNGSIASRLELGKVKSIRLFPDPKTFVIFPWRPREGAVARLLCDMVEPDGAPFPGCTRVALKETIKRLVPSGYLETSATSEFYLFNEGIDLDTHGPTHKEAHDQAGFCDLSPVDLGENVRRDVVLTLEEMGIQADYSHHAAGPGQHEIAFRSQDLLDLADNLVTFKFVVRTIAQRHGLRASFLPQPLPDLPGSGLTLRFRFDEVLAQELAESLGRNLSPILLFTNPLINSYKRLLRLPTVTNVQVLPGNILEAAFPDLAGNPYLALAAIMAAATTKLHGQEADCPQELPKNLGEAIKATLSCPWLDQAFPGYLISLLVKRKQDEWNRFQTAVHCWEIKEYFANY